MKEYFANIFTKMPDSIHKIGFPILGFIIMLCLKFRALTLVYMYIPQCTVYTALKVWTFVRNIQFFSNNTFVVFHCLKYFWLIPGNKNKGKGNGAGLAWESQSHCFADEFVITHAHSFGSDTQHDFSQGHCRTMSSIIIKLE